MREILATRDIGRLIRFLKSRGFSRSAIAGASGLSETQQVSSYEVFERTVSGTLARDGQVVEAGQFLAAYRVVPATWRR